jgi:hypothetical protein
MSNPSPDCAHANGLLLDLLYGELDGTVRSEVEGHAAGCARCTADLAAMRSTRQMMSTLEPEPAPAAGMESLLAYAQQQAQREASTPVRPAWRRWLLGAVPVAAVGLLGISVALESSRTHPATSLSTHEERALPEAEQGAVIAAAPGPEGDSKLDTSSPAAAVPALPPPAADDGLPAEPAAKLAAKEAAPRPFARREAAPAKPVAASAPVAFGSANALGGLGGAGPAQASRSAGAPVSMGGSGPSKKKLEASKVPASEGYATADRASPADSAAQKDAAPPPVVARAEEKREEPSSPPAGADVALAQGTATSTPAPAAAPGRATSRGMAMKQVAAADDAEEAADATEDRLGHAESLRRAGDHAAAADAYRQVFEVLRTGSRAELALYQAALEDRAAGKLAQSAEELERYARLFPRSGRAPTALAQAAEILRSRQGEGAATRIESDLLQRYPASAEASGLRSRSEASSHARQSKSAAPAASPAPASAGQAQPAPGEAPTQR